MLLQLVKLASDFLKLYVLVLSAIVIGAVLAGSLTSCVTTQTLYERSALSHQILSARPGYPGQLTNRVCLAKDENGACTWEEIVGHPLADADFRKFVTANLFTCRIGERIFRICPDRAGYCRNACKQKCFLGICGARTCSEEYLDAEDHDYLLNAGTECWNENVYGD